MQNWTENIWNSIGALSKIFWNYHENKRLVYSLMTFSFVIMQINFFKFYFVYFFFFCEPLPIYRFLSHSELYRGMSSIAANNT